VAKDFSTMEDSNTSANPSIHDVSDPTSTPVKRTALGHGGDPHKADGGVIGT